MRAILAAFGPSILFLAVLALAGLLRFPNP